MSERPRRRATQPAVQHIPPDSMGDATDRLAALLTRGRTGVSRLHRAFSDFAAELINRAASQAASVVLPIADRQEAQGGELAALRVEVEGLRALIAPRD